VLYLMSYGHHRGVLKTGFAASRRGWEVGRGREIRTPDILLPKQARYQTALYPDVTAKARVPTPVFRMAHNTHPLGERQRHVNDFTTVSEACPFHWAESSWENTRLRNRRISTAT
jgi:hypothetical protein